MDHKQVVYLMPDSYNALRKELCENWHNLWQYVQYDMAFDGPSFVSKLDNALDFVTQFDTDNVDGMCKKFLDGLRKLRGVSPLHMKSEYENNTAMEQEVRLARELVNIPQWKLPPTSETTQ